MADITMCLDKDCPLHHHCYRFTAPANQHRQSYFLAPRDGDKCLEFVSNDDARKNGRDALK